MSIRPLKLVAVILVTLATWPVANRGLDAQEPMVGVAELPQDVAIEIASFYNDRANVRTLGRFSVPQGTVIDADVAVLEGPVRLGGTITGRLVVINGNLEFESGGRVDGNVTVVGGEVENRTAESVGGRLDIFAPSLRYRLRGEELVVEQPATPREQAGVFSSQVGGGRVRLSIRSGTNYNRIEGLPVFFGPVFESGGTRPLRLEAFGLWRTNQGFDDDRLGYRFRLEQVLGGGGDIRLGVSAHSLVEPIEAWGIEDIEASLATFVLHDDYRDYYEREGWSAYVSAAFPSAPIGLRLEYLDEEHSFASVEGPWSLTRNDEPWRPQPLIAAGDLQSLLAEMTVDTRNSRERPTSGWLLRTSVRTGLDGSLLVPEHETAPEGGGEATTFTDRGVGSAFTSGFVDLRSYNRVGPTSVLSLRGILGGSIDGDPLPPQFQHALGGEGSLPGYPLFSVDCGARGQPFLRDSGSEPLNDPLVFASYGCDRMALLQVEYRAGTSWEADASDLIGGWGWDAATGTNFAVDLGWSAFFDIGRGWAVGDETVGGLQRFDTGTRSDVGAGLFVGPFNLYWAVPLDGDNRKVNFFIRLQHRF